METIKRGSLKPLFLIIALFLFTNSFEQITNPKKELGSQTEQRANNKITEGIDEGLNKVEDGIKNLFKKNKTNDESSKNMEEDETEQEQNSPVGADERQLEKPIPQKIESYTQYDFVPGDEILYYEDFSQDAIGDFPALWTTNGSGEVKTLNIAPGKWLHMNAEGAYSFTKEIDFPSNFIMEFDIIPNDEYNEYELTFYNDQENMELNTDLYPGTQGLHIKPNTEYGSGWLTLGYSNESDSWLEGKSARNPVVAGTLNHVIIWIQNRRLRIYHLGAKALDMPTNIFSGTKFNRFRFSGYNEEAKPYISNIKITTASPDTRSKLITESKLVSYGIYFDSGKDVVKPESYGSVKEIAKALSEAPDVRILIVGHTRWRW